MPFDFSRYPSLIVTLSARGYFTIVLSVPTSLSVRSPRIENGNAESAKVFHVARDYC